MWFPALSTVKHPKNHPARPQAPTPYNMIIILDDYGIDIERENASFLISKGGTKKQVSPHRVTAFHFRKPCTISTPAILLAAEFNLPLLFFNSAGRVKARLWQPHFGSHAQIRHQQMAHARHTEGLLWVKECIALKAEGQTSVLKFLANRVPAQAAAIATALTQIADWNAKLASAALAPESIRSAEAQMGRAYWEAYFAALEQYESADKRSRRPAADPLNALINYGYGMLYGEVESATLTAGLDPHIGILHREEYGKPAFVFDAIEPFRPWVDRLVAELALAGKIKSTWFEIKDEVPGPRGGPLAAEGAVVAAAPLGVELQTLDSPRAARPSPFFWLSKEGKKPYISAWYAMMMAPTLFNGKKIKRKDQIQHRLTTLGQYLFKTFSAD
jgi:CRISP-associated protein Cas1